MFYKKVLSSKEIAAFLNSKIYENNPNFVVCQAATFDEFVDATTVLQNADKTKCMKAFDSIVYCFTDIAENEDSTRITGALSKIVDCEDELYCEKVEFVVTDFGIEACTFALDNEKLSSDWRNLVYKCLSDEDKKQFKKAYETNLNKESNKEIQDKINTITDEPQA